jgi:hypothetical protein
MLDYAPPPSLALLRRDFISELRHRRSFWLAVVLLLAGIVLVALAWPRGPILMQLAARSAREMFAFFGVIHLVAASVLPPGLAALAFASERRQDTLDQLRLSLISTLGLVLAKLIASVGLIALLFVATLPILGVQLMLVGISSVEVLSLITMVLTTAFMGASIGLLCAVTFRRPLVAMVMAYFGMALASGGWLFLLVLPFILISIFFGNSAADKALAFFNVLPRRFVDYLAGFLYSALLGPYQTFLGAMPGINAATVLRAGSYRMAIALLCILLAAFVLRKPSKPLRVPKERPIDDPDALYKRRHQFPYYLVDPLRRRDLIADEANPVLARELRHALGLRLHVAFRIFALTALVAGFFGLTAAWPSGGMYSYGRTLQAIMAFAILGAMLVVLVLTSSIFTKEREQGNLGLLKMTLLTPYDVLEGKVAAGLATLSPFLLGLLVAWVPITFLALSIGHGGLPAMFFGLAALLACCWLTYCITFYMSVRTRSTGEALLGSFLINVGVYLGPALFAALLETLYTYTMLTSVRNWEGIILNLSPLIAYLNLDVMQETYRYNIYTSIKSHHFLLVWAGAVVVGVFFLVLAYRRLERLDERDV